MSAGGRRPLAVEVIRAPRAPEADAPPVPFAVTMIKDFNRLTQDLSGATKVVQRELRAALETVLPRDTGARACGRALGISRTQGWQAWSLAYAPDLSSATSRLLGRPGWRQLLVAIRRAGYPTLDLERLSNAVAELDLVLVRHQATASDLRSIAAGGRDTTSQAAAVRKALSRSRQAAELLHGVRGGLNAAATLIGPPNTRSRSRIAFLSLFEGLVRLRPGPPWTLYTAAITSSTRHRPRSTTTSVTPPLQTDLSTPDIADRVIRRTTPGGPIEFVGSDVGTTGGVRAVFHELAPGTVPLPADLDVASSLMTTTIPLRTAIFDMLLHRDRPMLGFATASLHAASEPIHRLRHGDDGPINFQESCRIPLEQAPVTLATPALPPRWRRCEAEYVTGLERAAASIGHRLDEFELIRLELPDPPLHCSIVLRWRWC